MMSEMFQQRGYPPEECIIEMDNYQDFLKVLQHHTFVGNISTTQLTQFIMMMVYMSFCRLSHYTRYMSNREDVLLKATVQMSLVVIAFKTTFSTKGLHQPLLQSDTYSGEKKHPCDHQQVPRTAVYMPKSCTMWSFSYTIDHRYCASKLPTLLELPQSISSDIQRRQCTDSIWKNHPDVDTSQSKWLLQSIFFTYHLWRRRAQYDEHVFTLAEDFFRCRLETLYPMIDTKGLDAGISFLDKQKLVNCPCIVHTEQRGFDSG